MEKYDVDNNYITKTKDDNLFIKNKNILFSD